MLLLLLRARPSWAQASPSPAPAAWTQADIDQMILDALSHNGTITPRPGFDPALLARLHAAVERILRSSTRVGLPPVPPVTINITYKPPAAAKGGKQGGGRRRLRGY